MLNWPALSYHLTSMFFSMFNALKLKILWWMWRHSMREWSYHVSPRNYWHNVVVCIGNILLSFKLCCSRVLFKYSACIITEHVTFIMETTEKEQNDPSTLHETCCLLTVLITIMCFILIAETTHSLITHLLCSRNIFYNLGTLLALSWVDLKRLFVSLRQEANMMRSCLSAHCEYIRLLQVTCWHVNYMRSFIHHEAQPDFY